MAGRGIYTEAEVARLDAEAAKAGAGLDDWIFTPPAAAVIREMASRFPPVEGSDSLG